MVRCLAVSSRNAASPAGGKYTGLKYVLERNCGAALRRRSTPPGRCCCCSSILTFSGRGAGLVGRGGRFMSGDGAGALDLCMRRAVVGVLEAEDEGIMRRNSSARLVMEELIDVLSLAESRSS